MANSKLRTEIVELLILELRSATQQQSRLVSVGLSLRPSSVRGICEQAGLSHTTFYRWLKASRAIQVGTRCLTQEEKLLRKFSRAVETYEQTRLHLREKKAGGGLLGSAFRADVLQSVIDLSDEMEDSGVLQPEVPEEGSCELSAFESRTDELVGSVGEVVLMSLIFHKKTSKRKKNYQKKKKCNS